MYAQFAATLVFLLLGTAFFFVSLFIGWLVRPSRPEKDKAEVYECGEPTIGSSWVRYNSRFYTVALVYLLFDVEVVLMVPIALVLREFGLAGVAWAPLAGLLLFVGVLVLGLAYEWRYGNLEWIGNQPGSAHAAPDTDGKV
jgi:NADH-quinone oxidoreductase subunit A